MQESPGPHAGDGGQPYLAEDLAYIEKLFPQIREIASPDLRRNVLEIWVELWRESDWERIEDCPKQPERYGPGVKMYAYNRDVAALAVRVVDALAEIGMAALDRDVVLAAALLQDASKLVEYDHGGVSERGRLFQHSTYVAHKAWERNLDDRIVHVIISHTPESAVAPSTPEAIVLSYLDFLGTDLIRGKQRHIGH